MKTRILLLCAAALFCRSASSAGALLPEGAFSDDARGLTSASFLKTPPSARFEALAGACLTQKGPQALFCNPAGLAFAPKGSVMASLAYEGLLEGSYRAGASIARGFGGGVAAAGFIYNDSSPGMEQFDSLGLAPLGGFSAYDSAISAAFARRWGLTDFGLGAKFIKSKLAETSDTSAALDAGFIFRKPGKTNTEFSLAARNFGRPLKLGSESAPLPLEFGGGLKWKHSPAFDIMLEGRLPCDHSPYLIAAGEWFLGFSPESRRAVAAPEQAFAPGFFVRGGMNFKNYSDLGAMGAFAGGFGLRLGSLEFDYAFVPYGELGATHRTEISWRFPGAEGAPRAAEKTLAKGAVAVIAPFKNGPGVTETQAEVFRNLFEAELGASGLFRIVEREKLDFILAEKKLAYAGLAEDKAAVELGRMTGAELAVLGFVSKEAEKYLITAKAVKVSSGEILRSGSAEAAEEYMFRQAARELVAGFSR